MSEPKIRLSQISPSATGTDSISGNVTITNDLTVGGNLVVSGNTTTLNVETLLIEDNELILNSNVASTPTLNAQITVNRGSSTNTFLLWDESADKWGWSDDGNNVTQFANALLKTGDTMTGELNVANNLVVTGNVGIKIADVANASLTIFGNSPDPFNTPVNILKLVTSAGNQGSSARIDMQVGAARPYIEALVTGPNSGSGAALAFATANTTGVGIERFRIDANGNVGIGTTNPVAALHISSAGPAKLKITADTDNVNENDVAAIELSQDGGFSTATFTLNDDNHLILGVNSTTSPSIFIGTRSDGSNNVTASDAKIIILNDGNMGIGTTNPSTTRGPLTVLMPSNQNQSGIVIRGVNSGGAGSQPALTFEKDDASVNWSIYADQGTNYLAINSGTTERLRVNSSGNVGINTTNPSTKFHVQGHTRSTQGYSSDAVLVYNAPAGTYNVGTWYTFTNRETIANLGLNDGIYIFRIFEDTHSAGGGNYFINYLTEPFWFYNVGSNGGAAQEFRISPIRMGHAANSPGNYISIRILEQFAGAPHLFQWSPVGANLALDGTGGKIVSISMYKFGGI